MYGGSMAKTHKLWRFFPIQSELTKKISSTFNVSEIISQLLINRGIDNEHEVQEFLYGDIKDLEDPFLLKHIDKAVNRIIQAINHAEKIVIYGDYDVDGITSTVLMLRAFRQLGAQVDYYIPDRQNEGYGLSIEALESLIQDGAKLVISVDCGISAAKEIECVKNRLDIIITDHHEPPSILPDALAVINPKQVDCAYPDKNLSGVGVAFKVCQAIWLKLNKGELNQYLDLVAVGTIADIVPLVGENRILVKCGLKQLVITKNLGLQALLNSCGVDGNSIDAGKVGYVLAPRLNAAGRLGQASLAVELLIAEDQEKAVEVAACLEYENSQRQLVEKEILAKAEEQLALIDVNAAKVLVLAGDNWHPGVIGIVASRLVDRYYRPTVVISIKDGVGKGSCRSIKGFNIYDALQQCGDLLLQYGGHCQAAGLSIAADRIHDLQIRLDGIAQEMLSADDYIPVLNIDAGIALDEINTGLLEQLACLAPFGMGNPSPVFACQDVVLSDLRAIGQNGRHLKFRVRRKNHYGDGIAWEMGGLTNQFQRNTLIDFAFHPEYNIWNGQCNIQLRTHDIRATIKELSDIDRLYSTECSETKYKNVLQAERFFTKIVGVTFENRQEIIAKLSEGQILQLRREPQNNYDSNAIKLETSTGEMVGYLRAELAQELAREIDQGCVYKCNITAVTGGGDCPLGVNILIYRDCQMQCNEIPAEFMADAEVVRQALLGDRDYHDSQKLVLEQLTAQNNVLAIMGTGRGKSAVFQTHAAMLALGQKKITIIIYPLRALVNDQFINLSRNLDKLGLKIFKGNGTLSTAERAALYAALYKGDIDILLTTPEFAEANLELLMAQAGRIGFFVIDECHHISHSAKQRSVYRRLDHILKKLQNPLVLGVTATADADTVNTIKHALGIEKVIIDKTVRNNLVVADYRNIADKFNYIANIVKRQEKTLIFVNSRKKAVELAMQLREHLPELDQQIGFYHAGLNNEWRVNVESWFRQGILKVVVATSAFGEGVDFSDIRHVIKYHLAFNLTTFNQQCGRAGRDGQAATIHLLFGSEDIKLNNLILKESSPERTTIGSIYLVLKGEYSNCQKVELTNQQIADQVNEKYREMVSDRGVSVAIRILEELNLLWRESIGKNRIIYLYPAPSHKLDLEQSGTYYEGMLEKTEFSLFAQRIMRVTTEEILTCINRPLYPEEYI